MRLIKRIRNAEIIGREYICREILTIEIRKKEEEEEEYSSHLDEHAHLEEFHWIKLLDDC